MPSSLLSQIIDDLGELDASIRYLIFQVTGEDSFEAPDLEELIERDPIVSGAILSLVNTTQYSLPEEVKSLNKAVALLGRKSVCVLALGIYTARYLRRRASTNGMYMKAFWMHLVAAAILSSQLAKSVGGKIAEEVFVAALLHDLGQPLLHRYCRNQYELALQLIEDDKFLLFEAEQEVFEIDHAKLLAALLREKGYPEPICYAIGYHHDPDPEKPWFGHVAALHAAEIAANLADLADGKDQSLYRPYHLRPEVKEILKIDIRELQESAVRAKRTAETLGMRLMLATADRRDKSMAGA